MDDAAHIGTGAQHLKMDRVFARRVSRTFELVSVKVKDHKVFSVRLHTERMARDHEAVGAWQARADVSESFDESAPVEKPPCHQRFGHQKVGHGVTLLEVKRHSMLD